MADIVRSNFAEECVRQGISCGTNPHYLLGVAQLRSKITEGRDGERIGVFRLTQGEWNLTCTDIAFDLDFLPSDIDDTDSQIAVFAVMARKAFDAFLTTRNRNPSAKELYLQQFPAAATQTLSADFKTALDATAALVDPAAEAVLDDVQANPPKITDPEQQVGAGVFNPIFNTFFTSLVQGGFFSSNPNSNQARSVRTNNPGGINISEWQKTRPGFVNHTGDDGQGNKTTIYSTPEYGIAAWYHLLAAIYNFGESGSFQIRDLAQNYAGPGAPQSKVDVYINSWHRLSNPPLSADSTVSLSDDDGMLNLARALFTHESGHPMPLKDEQIRFGIQRERNNSLPSPPAPPAVQVAAGGGSGHG